MENNKMEINKDRILKVLERNHSVNLFSSATRNKIADELVDSLIGDDSVENNSVENNVDDWSSQLLHVEDQYVMTTAPKEEREEVDAMYADLESRAVDSDQGGDSFGQKSQNKTNDPPVNVEKVAPPNDRGNIDSGDIRKTPPSKPGHDNVKRSNKETPRNRPKPPTRSESKRREKPVDGKKPSRNTKKASPKGNERGLKKLGK